MHQEAGSLTAPRFVFAAFFLPSVEALNRVDMVCRPVLSV
jgi:hypothetical protein